jgi:hypothetical protein
MSSGDNSVDETEQQKALAEVSMSQWNDYLENYVPFENAYMDSVDEMNTESSYNQVSGLAALPIEATFSNAVEGAADSMTSAGINPNSGTFKANMDKLDTAKRSAKVDSMTQAQIGQQNRYLTGLQNIVAMGTGQETTATAGLADVASMSANSAYNQASSAITSSRANQQLAGALTGAAARYGLNLTNSSGDA